MRSRFFIFILIATCLSFSSYIYAQSCATVYLNDDNLPSLPDALCVDDELALCFDLDVDEATFDASLVEFNYELVLGGANSEVELQTVYNSGTAIDQNASGQICFTAVIPAGPSACEAYELSLEIVSVFYNDPACDSNLIGFDLALTDPLPLVQQGDNLNSLIPLLGIAGFNPLLVQMYPNPNWTATITQAPACDGSTTATVAITAPNGDICETIENLGTAGMDGCPSLDAMFAEYTYEKFTTFMDVDGNPQQNPCAISITVPAQIIECSGVMGCTDAMACNYNPDACDDDGSCLLSDCNGDCGGEATPGSACDDGDAATENDVYGADCNCAGTGVSETGGCTDSSACNYNPDATEDDDSCLFDDCNGNCGGEATPGSACDDGNADTENDVYGEDCDCSGTPVGGTLGCTDPDYCNYDPDATVDDGSCVSADCVGVCGGRTLPGSNCDDFNDGTINETFNSNCECIGEVIENLCELDALDVRYACQSEENVTVEISFEAEGTYDLNDGSTFLSDEQSGTFTFENYPTNAGYELVVTQTEGNNVGCIIVRKFNTPRCIPCSAEAGLIGIDDYTQPEINVCEDDILQLRHTGTVLGRYQSIFFVMHTAGPDIGMDDLPLNEEDIIVQSRTIYNTEELSGNIWATAFVATTNRPGVANLEDPCLVISNTVKINFLEPIEINHSSTCDQDEGAYTFSLEVEGGLPGLENSGEYDVSSNYFNGTLGIGETYTSDLLPNGAMYSFSVTDNNDCRVKSELFIVSCADAMPIELVSFNAEVSTVGNLLKWVTASEINNDFFTIESSTNGIDYKKVAVVQGNGTNSSVLNYQYLHRSVNNGTTYYKLIQTDFDGTTEQVANLELTRSESTEFNIISILPVPAINNLEITLQSTDEQTFFEIYDVIGRPVLKEVYESKIGLELYNLDVSNLSSGVYFFSITNSNKSITKRFIKD